MQGELIDSWIRSLTAYFQLCPDITEDQRVKLAGCQLENIALTW